MLGSEILCFPQAHWLGFQSPFAAQSALKVITTHTNHNWDVFLFFRIIFNTQTLRTGTKSFFKWCSCGEKNLLGSAKNVLFLWMCETSKKQLRDITPEGCLVQSSNCHPAALSPRPNEPGVSRPGHSEAPSLEEDIKVTPMCKEGPVHESVRPCSGSDSE